MAETAPSTVEIGQWLGTDGSDMSALPRLAAELANLAADPNFAPERLAEIVIREPVLAARILRLVNSAYFGLSQRVTDIRHAVFLLGLRTVRTVALTAAVISTFEGLEHEGTFDLDRFWRHSISAAAAMTALARRCGSFDPETAFSLGLLHDIGKLVLLRYRPDDVARVVAEAEQQGLSFYDSERRLLPTTHPEVGAWLVERWRLPQVLVRGLAEHHNPPGRDLFPLHAALRFADYLCAIKGLTTSGSHGPATIQPQAWHALNLSSSDIPELVDAINTEIETAEALLRET